MSKAEETAKILLDTQCVRFSPKAPFTLTSGRQSPVYVDCRRLIAFVEERRRVIQFWAELLQERLSDMPFDCVAGGETAGIPYAAFLSETLGLPMAYIRKKPKGFGRNASIEGNLYEHDRVLLIEDMTTDGGSKVGFIEAIRTAGARVAHCAVVFEYGIFPEKMHVLRDMGVTLHSLATWHDIMRYARKQNLYEVETLTEVQRFLDAPESWSAQETKKRG